MAARVVRRLAAPAPSWQREADVVVVGSGAAGLATALTAAAGGRRVLVLTKGTLGEGSTAWAQGGLAAVLAPTDSFDRHVHDTLVAGAGLCDEAAVRTLVAAAPQAIDDLVKLGARFDLTADGGLALTREGGHSHDRVVHAGGDASGAEVSRTLVDALGRSGVEVLEHAVALDALLDAHGRVAGVTVLDARTGAVGAVLAPAVVLASGGFGQAFAATTNPAGATGDGLALALRAGAVVADVEFMQFHPTVLWRGPGAAGQQVLVSEAVRGEGAVLVDATGTRVMPGVHPLADLAPRDVVAAAMHAHMLTAPGGVDDHLWLDATALGRRTLQRRFPTILAACRAAGIDPVTEPIPVAPAAHYACGGVRADLDGVTSVPGLFAVGEVACTGVHGANRLASNSVTEGLVAGRRAGERLASAPASSAVIKQLVYAEGVPGAGLVDPSTRATSAAAMSRWAGVLRSPQGLARLADQLDAALGSAPTAVTLDVAAVEATNLHTVSTVLAAAASARAESRGCHRRSDVDGPRPEWATHLAVRLADDATLLLNHTSDREAAA